MADDLASYLDSLEREDRYRVDEVLKESAFEVTQRVMLREADGSWSGPYIRKLIKREQGLGAAYERVYAAQQQGRKLEHVPHVRECYARDGKTVVVMEFVAGETLQDLVYRLDPSVELARVLFPKLCDAVAELHEGFDPPLIHRDLKPSNVIVSAPGGVVIGEAGSGLPHALADCKVTVIDLGIAREYREGAQADTAHFGTRDFAPPEQFGYGQTSASSDVYALGMLLFFCLTEEIPTAAVRQAGFDDPRVPSELRRLIVQATSFDPAQRFNSAAALKRAFLNVMEGSVAQPAVQPSEPTVDEGGASRVLGRVWNVVVVGFCVFMVGYAAYLFATGQMLSPDRVPYSPLGSAVSALLSLALTASLGFACLDKRRLRHRVPALSGVRAWHAWALFAVCYLVATAIRGVIV